MNNSAQSTASPRPGHAGSVAQATAHPLDTAHAQSKIYQHGRDQPLQGYAGVMAVFGALLTAVAGLAAATGHKLPTKISPWDVVLLTFGTHKLSRTLAKDAVTSPLRAPFTRYAGTGGPAEVMENARDGGTARHAFGELITCPFCLDMWVATGFSIGMVFAPKITRFIATTFTTVAGADLLHLGYALAQQGQER